MLPTISPNTSSLIAKVSFSIRLPLEPPFLREWRCGRIRWVCGYVRSTRVHRVRLQNALHPPVSSRRHTQFSVTRPTWPRRNTSGTAPWMSRARHLSNFAAAVLRRPRGWRQPQRGSWGPSVAYRCSHREQGPPYPEQRSHRRENRRGQRTPWKHQLQFGENPSRSYLLVDREGIEPSSPGCKPGALPLS